VTKSSNSGKKDLIPGLPDQAYHAIRGHILGGRFGLGAAISRRRLALELGMSIVPVSAAFQRLSQEGLIETKPQVGTRIRIPTEADIRDRFILREALESQSARLFSERASMTERRELLDLAEALDNLYLQRESSPTDRTLIFQVNNQHMQFHMRIAQSSGSPGLCRLLETNDILVFNWLFDMIGGQPPIPPHFHRDLVASISGTDPSTVDAAMRAHIRYGLEGTVQTVRRIASQVESSWRLGRRNNARLPRSAVRTH
jgi:GntR family transcriptional regulator, rspAB operon transcriptional repressor